MLEALGALYTQGYEVDWARLHPAWRRLAHAADVSVAARAVLARRGPHQEAGPALDARPAGRARVRGGMAEEEARRRPHRRIRRARRWRLAHLRRPRRHERNPRGPARSAWADRSALRSWPRVCPAGARPLRDRPSKRGGAHSAPGRGLRQGSAVSRCRAPVEPGRDHVGARDRRHAGVRSTERLLERPLRRPGDPAADLARQASALARHPGRASGRGRSDHERGTGGALGPRSNDRARAPGARLHAGGPRSCARHRAGGRAGRRDHGARRRDPDRLATRRALPGAPRPQPLRRCKVERLPLRGECNLPDHGGSRWAGALGGGADGRRGSTAPCAGRATRTHGGGEGRDPEMEAKGAEVLVLSGRRIRGSDVERVLLEIAQECRLCAASCMRRGSWTSRRFSARRASHSGRVAGPKMLGAVHLHAPHGDCRSSSLCSTRRSSRCSARLGRPTTRRQTRALDAIAQGRPRTAFLRPSIHWGPFSDAGHGRAAGRTEVTGWGAGDSEA